MRKLLFLFFMLAFPVLNFADTLDGVLAVVTNETNANPLSIEGYVGSAVPDTGRTTFICFDGSTSNCQTVLANQTIWSGNNCFLLAIPSGYKNNGYHTVYAWLQAQVNAGLTQPQPASDLLLIGSPLRFSVSGGVLQPAFVPASTSNLSIPSSSICLVYNTNAAIDSGFSSTFGPWYAAARGLTNVVPISLPTLQYGYSLWPTDFATLMSEINAGCSAQTQWIALAWAIPSKVNTDNAICFAVTNGGYQSPVLYGGGGTDAVYGWNSYFNTANVTPYSTYGIRPTILVTSGGASGTGDVTLAEAMVNTAKSGDNKKPTAVADVLMTSNASRNMRAQAFSTVNLGTTISSKVSVSVPSQDYLTSTINILGYFGGEATYSNFGTSTWVAGGFGDSLTSYNGLLPSCSGQTCATWFIDNGAVGAYGSSDEPYTIPQRFPEPSIFLSRYTSGMPLIAAAWGSLQENWYGANFFGDPLAQPYGGMSSAGQSLSGASISGGSVK